MTRAELKMRLNGIAAIWGAPDEQRAKSGEWLAETLVALDKALDTEDYKFHVQLAPPRGRLRRWLRDLSGPVLVKVTHRSVEETYEAREMRRR